MSEIVCPNFFCEMKRQKEKINKIPKIFNLIDEIKNR